MIVGIDTYRDSQSRSSQMIGFVASINPTCTRYYSRVIEQRNKKNSMEYGWLSKTDMTIVAVSILFVILLAIINLILFAVRR